MSKKIWIILAIIIACLILIHLIIRTIMVFYIEAKMYESTKKALVDIANKATLEYRFSENNSAYVDTEDISELKKGVQEHKNYVQNQINELKTKGETEIMKQEIIIYCKDGVVEYYDYKKEHSSYCGGSENITKTEAGEFKNFTYNGSQAIMEILISSIFPTLGDYGLYGLENLESSKKTITNTVSVDLDYMIYMTKKIVFWQVAREAFITTGNKTNLIDTDVKEAIIAIENFDKSYETPTEQEINSINLKEKCIVSFKEAMKEERSTSVYFEAFKTSFLGKILFINYNIKKICENLEKIEKENAIKMLKDNENEQNPFISIERKLYLNVFVNCSEDIFPRECKEEYGKVGGMPLATTKCSEDVCTENYKEEFLKRVAAALNTTEIPEIPAKKPIAL